MKELFAILLLDAYANKLDIKYSLWAKLKGLAWLYWYFPNFACVFWYRVNRYWPNRRLNAKRIYWFGNDISQWADIGAGLRLIHMSDIVIGRRVKIGKNCSIANGVTLGEKNIGGRMPRVGDNVYLGTGAKILGDIEIGDNSIIGALTFCDKSVPKYSVAYGNPMVIKRK